MEDPKPPANFHVYLVPQSLRFKIPPSKPGNLRTLHFDECNKQIIVTSNRTVQRFPLNRQTDRHKITSISLSFEVESIRTKFSLDHKFLAIQRASDHIQIINLTTKTMCILSSKKSKESIVGFWWTSFEPDDLAILTRNGLELYESLRSKNWKLTKEFKFSVSWYLYSSSLKLLIYSSNANSNNLFGFYFKAGVANKIPKIDLDNIDAAGNPSIIRKQDISLCQLYSRPYLIHVNGKRLVLYKLSREVVKKSLSIDLHTDGDVMVHVVDNLIVVHNLKQKITMLFDIKENDPLIASPLPLAPCSVSSDGPVIDPYIEDWQYFQPNYIIDLRNSCIFETNINIESISQSFADKIRLIDFLLRRKKSKYLTLKVFKTVILEGVSLAILAKLYDKLNVILAAFKEEPPRTPPRETPEGHSITPSISLSPSSSLVSIAGSFAFADMEDLTINEDRMADSNHPIVDQHDMYQHVFSVIEEGTQTIDEKYFIAVLLEYIRSLHFHQIEVKHFLYELIINSLVRNNRFYQLHQLLQYHVISDSVPVACQLLSLENKYPAGQQLALDMLQRLGSPADIIEVLLTRKQLILALRLARQFQDIKISSFRFLEAAATFDDEVKFYTIYKYFEQKGGLTPECQPFVEKYQSLFGTSPLSRVTSFQK